MSMRVLQVSLGLVTAAAMLASPAHADMVNNSFLAALSNAGVAYADPMTTIALGQSICPMLVQADGMFDNVASKVARTNGLPREEADMFTIVAIAAYCPAIMSPLLPDRRHA